MAGAAVPYDPTAIKESTGNLGGGQSVAATPNDFGAQVGAATEKAGDAAFDVAQKEQGIVNETLMTNADAALATKVGQIKGEYLQNTGLAAKAAFPQYQLDLEAARQEARKDLPPAAQRGFDMLSVKTIANHIADGSTYMAGQTKAALIDSGTNLTSAAVQAMLDPQIASNPARVQDHQDAAIHGLQMGVDEDGPGIKKNPETGEVSFDTSTPAGVAAKANYDANKDNIITQVQSNRFDTLSKIDEMNSYSEYLKIRDELPRSTQVHLDSTFAPKVFNAQVNSGVTEVMAHAEQEHAKLLYSPQKTPLDVIRENEGYTGKIGRDSNGANVINGINERSFPTEYAEAKNLLDTKGKAAADAYADSFYQKNIIDKYDIKSLPPETQTIVADGLVNHGAGEFGKSLITAAQNGASPQQLIDMRRNEYQRLADADTDGSKGYAASLKGWDARLDKFEASSPASPSAPKSYGTNENGGPLTPADYYRTHSEDVLQRADALAEKQMPGDLAYKRAMRETATNYMNKVISNQSAQYVQDNKNVIRAINGELTKGNPPQTEADLRAIPGMSDLLNKVSAQDPKFAEGIPTMISKAAHQNTTINSPNAYNAVLSALDTSHDYTRQGSIDFLSKGLGSNNPGESINMKDFNDAKPAIDLDHQLKSAIAKDIKNFSAANGNIDGKGEERAVQRYNTIMSAWKQNTQGEKPMSVSDFIASMGVDKNGKIGPLAPNPPSRAQQIQNAVQKPAPVLTDKAEFDALPSGAEYIRDGNRYRKP